MGINHWFTTDGQQRNSANRRANRRLSIEAEQIINHWFRLLINNAMSIDDICRVILDYYISCIMLFSTTYKSKQGWKLSDDNQTVTRIAIGGNPWEIKKWILADTDILFEGVHCWRIQIINPKKGWLSIGVSQQNMDDLNNKAFGNKYVWAIGLNNNWYPSQNVIRCDTKKEFRLEYVELDILLDLDSKKLKICRVDDKDEIVETIMTNAPENDKGWVPYFNAHYEGAVNCQMRAIFIDTNDYGVPIKNLFS